MCTYYKTTCEDGEQDVPEVFSREWCLQSPHYNENDGDRDINYLQFQLQHYQKQ